MELDDLPFQILQEITDGFSKERKLGEGAFGVVYKGVTKNGDDVAVKKLHSTQIDYKQFQNEYYNLRKVKHKNIVQVLGYCYETEQKHIMHDGRMVSADYIHRALCLEYVHNGSLQGQISDEFCGLDWHTRFKIIKGICEGLKYIHELEEPIYHLDLKPDNILLDKDMVPKIADFGLSRILGKEVTWTTQNPYGTVGYQPPEYIERGEISGKFDIFSLGVVMIRIVSGSKGYPRCLDISSDAFIDQVQENWRKRLQPTCSSELLEASCHQVEKCTQIGLECLDKDSQKRPDMEKITEKLNEIETRGSKLPKKRRRKCFSGMTNHNDRKKMRKESKNTAGQHQNNNLMLGGSCSELEFVDARETSSNVVEELIVGRTEEKEKIMTQFESVNVGILPIYGIGGIGKTTFARLIYNDPKFKCYSHAWIHVSPIFNLNKICESIISQISGKESMDNERQMIHCCLAKLLSGKKTFIVLDNLWEDDQFNLEELKDMLCQNDSSIIILVTTCSERVAQRICTNFKPYKVLPLTNDMCWEIIKRRSGFEYRDDKQQLMDIGQEIAQKCGGVALAALSIGFTLQSMNSDEWMKVKDSHTWNEIVSNDLSFPNHVFASLKLSYTYMSPGLKPCFTYCATFPKGHKIVKNDLIYQWISLEFIKPTKLLSNVQLCEKYIVQLLGLSFLQQHPLSASTSGAYNEHAPFFTMHDLVHDLAISVPGADILYHCKKGNTLRSSCRYALLDCIEPLTLSTRYPGMLRALRFQDSFRTDLLILKSSAKSLRVLDFSERSDGSVGISMDWIGELKQLRYLNAPLIQDPMVLNCITKLSKLYYLNLQGSIELLELPESFGDMKDLLHLDLSGCSKIKQLPESFRNLENLMHLDLSKCSSLTGVPESLGCLIKLQYLNLSDCKSIGELPKSFGNLSELQYLNLSDIRKLKELPRSFSNLCGLVHLNLSYCVLLRGVPESLSGLTKLRYLNLSRCSSLGYKRHESLRGLQEVLDNLTELRYLNLGHCLESMYGDQAADETISLLCKKSNVEYLNLCDNKNLYSIPENIAVLEKLHTLVLSFCDNLQRLPASISKIGSLKFLEVKFCSKLDMSTVPQSINSSILLPNFVVHASDDGESTSTLVLLEYENPPELYISMLENVMSTEEAQRIKLVEKKRIKQLELAWTGDAKRLVDDTEVLRELVPPDSVSAFKLIGYNSISFPSWMADLATYLPHLVIIYLLNLPNCKNIPPFGQLPNLKSLFIRGMDSIKKIGPELYGGTRPFRRLERITLIGMDCLEEWNTTYSCGDDGLSELVLPSLLSLNIYFCPKLSFKPRLPEGKNYKLSMKGSDKLILSPWGDIGHVRATSYTAATELVMEECDEPLHKWSLLRHLPGLTSLTIKHCSDLTCESPDFLRGLSSLQRLTIKNCKFITALPDMLGDLISLTELEILNCKRIECLPESIQQLTCLQRLQISSCPKLVQWCELQENKQKLNFIEEREIGDHFLQLYQQSESDLDSDDQESESDLDSEYYQDSDNPESESDHCEIIQQQMLGAPLVDKEIPPENGEGSFNLVQFDFFDSGQQGTEQNQCCSMHHCSRPEAFYGIWRRAHIVEDIPVPLVEPWFADSASSVVLQTEITMPEPPARTRAAPLPPVVMIPTPPPADDNCRCSDHLKAKEQAVRETVPEAAIRIKNYVSAAAPVPSLMSDDRLRDLDNTSSPIVDSVD